jgi:two-component system, sensor histidine kinase RegB
MSLNQRFFTLRGAPNVNLRRLYVLRNIAIAGQALTVAWVQYGLGMPLPLSAISLVIALLAGFNLLTRWRFTRTPPVTDLEIFLHLLIDAGALTALLYLSGGGANPFVSLYLLPLVTAAITLPRLYTGLMAAVTTACYTLLMFLSVPLPAHHGGVGDFHLHLIGMWLNFLLSAALIVLFVTRMAATLRERDRMLAAAREEILRNERIVALGTFAAGAAHELGTPLSTMAVITKELQRDYAHLPALAAEMRCLRDQVDICKRSLTRLLAVCGHERTENIKGMPVEAVLDKMLEQWRLMRPAIPVASRWTGPQPSPIIAAGQILAQTITNLFNNAADASPQGVDIKGAWNNAELSIQIRDHGPGITAEVASRAGEAFVTTKAPGEGLGLGLFLANATIERLGGEVRLFNRAGGGACTEVTLPLVSLMTTGLQA